MRAHFRRPTCPALSSHESHSSHDTSSLRTARGFRKFLVTIEAAVPAARDLHLIVDNASTHKTPAIHRWLMRHPRFHVHFTPTSGSWMNLVELRGESTTPNFPLKFLAAVDPALLHLGNSRLKSAAGFFTHCASQSASR